MLRDAVAITKQKSHFIRLLRLLELTSIYIMAKRLRNPRTIANKANIAKILISILPPFPPLLIGDTLVLAEISIEVVAVPV